MCVICMCAMYILLFFARGRRKCDCCIDSVNSMIKPDGFALITSIQRLPSYDTPRLDYTLLVVLCDNGCSLWPVAGRHIAGTAR